MKPGARRAGGNNDSRYGLSDLLSKERLGNYFFQVVAAQVVREITRRRRA